MSKENASNFLSESLLTEYVRGDNLLNGLHRNIHFQHSAAGFGTGNTGHGKKPIFKEQFTDYDSFYISRRNLSIRLSFFIWICTRKKSKTRKTRISFEACIGFISKPLRHTNHHRHTPIPTLPQDTPLPPPKGASDKQPYFKAHSRTK